MKIYIYNIDKFVEGLFVPSRKEFEKNPTSFFPEWKEDYILSEIKFDYPIWENKKLREATREERILKFGRVDELSEGEVIENNEIKTIEKPESLIRPVWDKESKSWIETMTKEELLLKRKNKIINYIDIKNEIEKLKESEFESEETIIILENQLQELKTEINKLAEYVKKLKGAETNEN